MKYVLIFQEGCYLVLRDLHVLLPHQAQLGLHLALHRQNIRRHRHIYALFNLRVLVGYGFEIIIIII